MSVTQITSCTTTSCAFNNGGCTAYAITVGGDNGAPACDTFISLDARGGLPVAEGHVGACQRLECVHNKDLMCTANAVTVGGDTASCQTSEVRGPEGSPARAAGGQRGMPPHGGIPRFGIHGQAD